MKKAFLLLGLVLALALPGLSQTTRAIGTGSPESVVTAGVGSTYQRTDCLTAATCLYIKTSGTGNTGWTAVDPTGSGEGITALTGDVTATGPGSTAATIAARAVTAGKFFSVTDNRLLGRSAGSNGDVQEIAIGTGLSLSGGTLSATGGGGGSSAGSMGDVQVSNGVGGFSATNLNSTSNVLTHTRTSLGNTRTDGLVIQNTTAAASGVTQFSQSLRFAASGYKTTATAAARTVEVNLDLRPIEQTTNPAYGLQISTQCATCTTGTSFSQHSVFGVAVDGGQYAWLPGGGESGWPGLALGPNFGSQASPVIAGFTAIAGGSYILARPAGGNGFGVHGDKVVLLSGANLAWNNNASSIPTGTNDLFLRRRAAATLQLGAADSAVPVNQTLATQGSIGGTNTNTAGANLTIQSGLGTGNASPTSLILRSPQATSSGSTQQTAVTGLTIFNGTAVLTSYTVANLPSASTSGVGALAFVTDSNSTTRGVAVTGGGSNKVVVYSDGANWIIL